jgi:hypothetical protein
MHILRPVPISPKSKERVFSRPSIFLVVFTGFICAGCQSGGREVAQTQAGSIGFYQGVDPSAPASEVNFPDSIKHILIEPSDGAYQFLHDPAIVHHEGQLIAAWYNCPRTEIADESCIRARRSSDRGLTWSEVEVVAEDKEKEGVYYVPAQLLSLNKELYAFVGKMTGHDRIVNTTTFRYVEDTKRWQAVGVAAHLFLPNCTPVLLDNGNWAMSGRVAVKAGELPLIPAVMISDGDRVDAPWRIVYLQKEPYLEGEHPETTLLVEGATLYAFTRVNESDHKPNVYISSDYGESWEKVVEHNLRTYGAKMYAGRLSDGRGYLAYNYPVPELDGQGMKERGVLALALSEPGASPWVFSKIHKIQAPGPGRPSISHYPCVTEHDGNLYVVYTAHFDGEEKRQCEMAIVPVASL